MIETILSSWLDSPSRITWEYVWTGQTWKIINLINWSSEVSCEEIVLELKPAIQGTICRHFCMYAVNY